MAIRVQVLNKYSGLHDQADPLELPEGAFERLDNVVLGRDGIIESRRGYSRYGSAAGTQIAALLEFQNRLIRHSGTTLAYDADGAGNWTSYSGSFSAPSGSRIRGVEAKDLHILTTSLGPYRQSAVTETPTRAGIPQATDVRLGLTGTGNGPFSGDSQVSYKIVFGRRDSAGRELYGAPTIVEDTIVNTLFEATYTSSGATITVALTAHPFTDGDTIFVQDADDPALDGVWTVANSAADTFDFTANGAPTPNSGDLTVGKDYNVEVHFALPSGLLEGDFVEIYRTQLSPDAITSPSQEFFKATQLTITSGDISAGTITYTDVSLDDFLGIRLYTNPSQGSVARANHQPPFATDVCLYRGHVIYVAAQWEQEKEIQLKSLDNIVDGTSSITLTQGMTTEEYTFAAAEDVGDKEFQHYTTFSTLAENVENTARSLVYVINRASALFQAYYTSTENDPPGKVLIRRRILNTAAFTLTADHADTGANFDPVLPDSGTTIVSGSPGGQNVIAVSKFEQPEAVPRLSTLTVGSSTDAVVRALTLRDSVVVLKPRDGVFLLQGESDGTVGRDFFISLRDSDVKVRGANTAVVLDNRVWMTSNIGVVAVSEEGSEIVSRQIERRVRRLSAFSNWNSVAHAIAYPSEHAYILFCPDESTDTHAKRALWLNNLVRQWSTGIVKDCSTAHVLSADDRLYLAHGEDDFVLRERKSQTDDGNDYVDEEISVTVTQVDFVAAGPITPAHTAVNVTYTYAGADLVTGFLFAQGSVFARVDEVEDFGANTYRLHLTEVLPGVTTGAATVSIPIEVSLRTGPLLGKNASILKQYTTLVLEFEDDQALKHEIGFVSDIVPVETYFSDRIETLAQGTGWGTSAWGSSPWGDAGLRSSTPLSVNLPADFQRARRLRVLYRHRRARQKVALSQIAILLREISWTAKKVPRIGAI